MHNRTRLPARLNPWSQRAEWKARPWNPSSPGRSGTSGSLSAPDAITSTDAVSGPFDVSIRQSRASASHAAPSTSCPKRTWGSTPKSSAQRLRYAWISGCGEKLRVHPGLGANEKEYRCDCTSHSHPG